MSGIVDLLIHGGSIGSSVVIAYVGWKVKERLDRDDSLKADYPPHRHVNGHVLYPKDYQPSEVGTIKGTQ